MRPSQTVAAPTEAEAATTHKENSDNAAPSFGSLSDWRLSIVAWFSGGPKPPFTILRQAGRYGIPDQVPASPKDRVRVLALAQFDIEHIIAAVPELHPIQVVEVADRVPGEAHTIIENHLAGYTPLEISQMTEISRPRTYYWLQLVGLEPNRRSRDELTARQRDQIVKAWRSGEPMASIASRFNVSYDQVRYAVRKA